MKSERCGRENSRGMPVTRGSSESTRLTLAQGPSILMPAMARAELVRQLPLPRRGRGTCASGRRSRRRPGAAISAPSSRSTPRARPSRTSMRATGADVADLGAELAGGRGHGLRDRAHAADHVAVEALELVLAARQEVEEQAERRAGRVGSAVLAVDVVGEEERLDLLGLVVAVEEVSEAAGQERDHAADLAARDRRETPADPQRLEEAREAPRVHVRRRLEKEGLEVAREPLQLVVDADERARVARPRASSSSRTVRSRSDHQGTTVPSGNGTSSAGSHGTIRRPWTRQLEVADHLGPQHARDVGGRRGAAAGRDLLGHAGAADDLSPLEDERREAAPRQVGGRRQAVVAARPRRWRRRSAREGV